MTAAKPTRVFAARALLIVAALALLWTIAIVVLGGFSFRLFGHLVRNTEPLRPFAVAVIAIAGFVRLYGATRAHELWTHATRRLDEGPMAVGLAIFILVIGLAYNSTAAAGSDAYGYVSQADLWLKGDLRIEQPWALQVPWPTKGWSFTPLGYRPLDDAHQERLVPTYSPGLPLLMAAANRVGGRSATFWIVPMAGAILVYMTYGIGRRLGSRRAGLIGAWFVATSPVVLLMLMFPMSDVPVAAMWATAIFLALGSSWRSAAGAGLAAGTAILIRPNLVPLAGVIGVVYVARGWRSGLGRAAVYSMGAVAGMAATALINKRLYGSPFISGYGDLGYLFGWSNILPNLKSYAAWLVQAQTPLAFAGLVAIFVPLRRFWPSVQQRWIFAIAALFILTLCAEYFAYLQFDNWLYLRFLLPAWPWLMIGMGAVALGLARTASAGRVLAISGLLVCLGVYEYRRADQLGVFDVWRTERANVLVARRLRDLTQPNSVVLSMTHSGSVRYYAGRMTMRFDLLDADWLDRGIAWLADHGAHPYLLVNDWELPQFTERFRSQKAANAVSRPPMLAFRGSTTRIFLFDLLPARGDSAAQAVAITDLNEDLRSVPPADAPKFLLQ